MNPGSRNGREGNTGALNQAGFHSALAAHPKHWLSIMTERFQYGECGIHAPAGPASANQQPH